MKSLLRKYFYCPLLRVYLLCKRQCRQPFFLLLLAAVPICCLLINTIEKQSDSTGYQIALACENPDDLTVAVINELINKQNGLYTFILLEEEASVKEAVLSQEVSFGYVFPEHLLNRLQAKNNNRCITIYTNPSSSFVNVCNEEIFSVLFRSLGEELLYSYINNSDVLTDLSEEIMDDCIQNYIFYTTSDSVFHAEYQTIQTNGQTLDIPFKSPVFPVRGMIAILMFISGLSGGLLFLNDKKNGLSVSGFLLISVPVFLFTISAYVTLSITGMSLGFLYESIRLLLYGLIIVGFVRIFIWLIPNQLVISVSIPFFTLGSLLCCPIFIHASDFLPWMQVLEKFFLPYYYLCMF